METCSICAENHSEKSMASANEKFSNPTEEGLKCFDDAFRGVFPVLGCDPTGLLQNRCQASRPKSDKIRKNSNKGSASPRK